MLTRVCFSGCDSRYSNVDLNESSLHVALHLNVLLFISSAGKNKITANVHSLKNFNIQKM